MAEKVPNSQRIQVLQGEVASMRGQGPGIICTLMDKERQLLTQNLKESDFVTGKNPNISVKEVKKLYIANSLLEVQKPSSSVDNQIDLNATTDALIKCIEYLKK